MAGDVAASPGELIAVAGWLDRVAQEISDALDGQMREVRAFLGVDWQGGAATSHENPWADWEEGARRVVGSFGVDAGLLRRAANEYTSHDRARAESIDAAGSSLDLPPVV
ncbi:WXG100 family type VII secretion target [Nocardia acidivorans]|uniref:WXG100 family type VII secretion target n=1 Tax=Nocardia acidivorans TaxID=404580 RepID=UPI000B1CD572|nr:WXG100 family type VII secretion target [Nocardia acidivorans]